MVSIICTIIVCATVLVLANRLAKTWINLNKPSQQPVLTEEELKQALKEADDAPNFQDVIEFINKEFTGVEDSDE